MNEMFVKAMEESGIPKEEIANLLKTNAVVAEMSEMVADFEPHMFMSAMCMMLECYCRDNEFDVVDMAEKMRVAVRGVNEDYGKFE